MLSHRYHPRPGPKNTGTRSSVVVGNTEGLAWEEVLPLIRTHLGDLKIPVYVYTQYLKGIQAREPVVV